MIHPMDFVKYGFVLFVLSMVVVWVLGFLVVYNVVGFPPDILETARGVMEAGTQ
jgi:sodium-dependent dicarboxylate transporter 2/3/5